MHLKSTRLRNRPRPPSEGQGRGPASQQGNRLTTHMCGQGPCPWCCLTAGSNTRAAQLRGPRPRPRAHRTLPSPSTPPVCPARPPPLHPPPGVSRKALPHTPLPADPSQRDKRPLSPRWEETQSCCPNWHFPVDGTFYAFFTCII